jgi:hypothetical protein
MAGTCRTEGISMAACDVAADRAELLSAATSLSRARATLAACGRIPRKFGDEAGVTVEQLEVARNRVKQFQGLPPAPPKAGRATRSSG